MTFFMVFLRFLNSKSENYVLRPLQFHYNFIISFQFYLIKIAFEVHTV